jgi:aryl-alcohol dehydrogenase-like predicted oxidoreductase/MoaA/NifB/PqqE/SkfB family radical SAM enzyme
VSGHRRLHLLEAATVTGRTAGAELELQLGHVCNNRCVFCVSGQLTAQGLARPLPAAPAMDALAEAAARGARKVTFLGGEPTLQPSFLPALARAIELGFAEIVIFTNGVKTARASYLDEILALGAARGFAGFTWRFSIQGGDEAAHDRVTGKPGSFRRLIAGVRHLQARGQRLTANACVNAHSFRSLPAYPGLVAAHGIRQLHLDQVRPRDAGVRSDAELRAIMPPYTEMVPYYREMLAGFARALGPDYDVNVGNLPYCLMPEWADKIHHDGEPTLTVAADGGALSRPWDKYADKRRDKFHPPGCDACRFRDRCNGVFAKYAELHGTAEFVPVPKARPRPAPPDPPAMKYRTLPGTDLQLSAIGLGCWALGGEGWGADAGEDAAASTIAAALELGVDWFDTAPLYGDADARLVRALGGRRHDVVIATKAGARRELGGRAVSDLSPAHLVADVEASLRRLRLDVLPLLQVHWPCERGTPLAATLDALRELQRAGKLRHFGLCNYGPDAVREALAAGPLASLQTPYSMVRREFEAGLKDLCVGTGPEGQPAQRLGVLAYEALCRGLLGGRHRAEPRLPADDLRARDPRFAGAAWRRIDRLVQALVTVGERVGAPPAALAVAWVLRRPGVSVAIVGARRPWQVREQVQALAWLGHARVWQALAPHVDACRP